jgi:hypothetical protein
MLPNALQASVSRKLQPHKSQIHSEADAPRHQHECMLLLEFFFIAYPHTPPTARADGQVRKKSFSSQGEQTGGQLYHSRISVRDVLSTVRPNARQVDRVLGATARHDLLEILEERYDRRSTIVTSQLPLDRWHEIIADPTYADAILDRLVHNAHRIELSGESLRRTRGKQNQKA